MKSEKKEEPQASKDSVMDPKSKRQKCKYLRKNVVSNQSFNLFFVLIGLRNGPVHEL